MKSSLPYNPIFLALFFYLFNVKAQDVVYKHYSTEEGLPHDITYQIIQDSKGFIWAGTDDGLVRFNGKEFKTYGFEKGLKSNYVIDVVEDVKNNQYFIATWGRGIHILKNDTILKNESPNKKDLSKINKIYKINDSIVVGFTNTRALYSYNSKSHMMKTVIMGEDKGELVEVDRYDTSYLHDVNQEQVNGEVFLYDSELNTSLGKAINGIYKLTTEKIEKLQLKEIDSLKLQIHGFTQENGYSIFSSYNTLYFYDQQRFLNKKKLKLPPGKIIQIQVFNNKLFFVHINREDGLRQLYSYSAENNYLTNISNKIGIINSISDFLFDKDASLWITTYGSGIYQLLNTKNVFLDNTSFQKDNLSDVTSLSNGVVTMAPNILYYLDDNNSVSHQKIPFHTESFQKIKGNQLNLIIPNSNGVSFHCKFKNIEVGSDGSKVFKFIVKDEKKIKLIYNKVEISNTKSDTIIKLNPDELGNNVRKALLFKDKIYAIFESMGVYCFDVTTHEFYKWNKKIGISANSFTDILIYKNAIWLGTNTGLYKIENEESIKHYTIKDGLISNHINGIFVDQHDVLWVATQRGLNVFKDDHFYHIDKNLGQRSSSIKKVTEYNDYLYVIGNKGMFICENQKPFDVNSHTELLMNQQEDAFLVIPINYINPNTIRIQFQLNQDSWTNLLSDKINLQNLEEGNYTLSFRYKDGLSNWSYTEKYPFKVTKPWYNSTWIYICLILVTLAILLLIVYKQLLRVKKKNKVFKRIITEREKLQEDLKNVRHQIAQDFHDDLGNKLASISMLSNLSLKKSEKEDGLYNNLYQINKDANFLYRGMRDFVWSLDYKNNSLSEVQIYLNDFGEKLFEFSEINFKSKNNVSKSEVFLPHYWNKQLVLVFKEAMTNAFKHSKATEVFFYVFYKDGLLEITLEDNGIGYDFEAKGRRNGLLNMKERVKTINGELNFSSNNGCKVYFKGKIT